MVMPLSLSALRVFTTHAYLKEALPISDDYLANLSMAASSTTPQSCSSLPVRVDLPASTWPITTMFVLVLLLVLNSNNSTNPGNKYLMTQF